MTQRVTDLWTGYEHHAGRWYAMYCNVDLDQSERNKRDDLVWVRNNEVATAAAELASLRAKLAAVCRAGETLASEVLDICEDPYCDGPRCLACFAMKAAIAAAGEGEK